MDNGEKLLGDRIDELEKKVLGAIGELKKDVEGEQDAMKELTKTIAGLTAEQEKLRKSGRF